MDFRSGSSSVGLLAIPLLALLGSTEDLLLGTTVAQLAFLGLLLETERRFPEVRSAPAETSQEPARPSARTLFASGLVLLILVYQVLSAMGSWLVDYLLFNRANAHYSGDDLTRFLSWYTAVLNLADILFLALLAGPLLRRFGLRLGLVLNPAVVAALLAAMAVVVAGPGAAVYGLFVLAAVTRLTDIVLTDGTTRTSVNASFQVVPIRDRLAVQAVVEGIGVPVAIGATGAVLLLMNLLGLGIGAVIVFGAVLSVIWTGSGVAMYRSYTHALADEMRRRSLVASAYDVAEDDAALQALLRSNDARDVRLGLDLLPGIVSLASTEALRQASEHADPEVRLRALVQLAADGDARCRRGGVSARDGPRPSADPAERRAAASALGPRRTVTAGQSMLIGLLDDPDPIVRAAALDSVVPADAGEQEVVSRVVAALEEARTAAARPPQSGGSATRLSLSSQPRSPATERRGARLSCVRPPMRRRSTARGDRARAPRPRSRGRARGGRRAGCGRRRRRRTVRPPRRRVRRRSRARSSHSRCARGARRFPIALSEERWRTRATSHDGSSSPCSRFATAMVSATRFASWTAQRDSVAHSASRRSTCSSRGGGRDRPSARSPRPHTGRAGGRATPCRAVRAQSRRLDRRYGGRSGRRLALPLARPLRAPRGRTLIAGVRPDATQRLGELLRADRLGEVVVHPGGEARLAVLDHGVRRHRDDAGAGLCRPRAQISARGVETVHLGHLHVHQHDVVGLPLESLERLEAVRRDVGAVAQLVEDRSATFWFTALSSASRIRSDEVSGTSSPTAVSAATDSCSGPVDDAHQRVVELRRPDRLRELGAELVGRRVPAGGRRAT